MYDHNNRNRMEWNVIQRNNIKQKMLWIISLQSERNFWDNLILLIL